MLPETTTYLDERGYMRDGKVARDMMIGALVQELRRHPLEQMPDGPIGSEVPTVPELRSTILGEPAEEVATELDQIVGSLLAVGPKGRVQRALDNGFVLFAPPVQRVEVAGEAPRKRRGRAISDNPDVIYELFEVPQLAGAIKHTETARDACNMAVKRIPALASRQLSLLGRTQEQIGQLLLVEHTQPNGGGHS